MKALIAKAKRLFKPDPKGVVYFRVVLDGNIVGISITEPEKPWILVQGLTLEEGARVIPRIDWHTVPMRVRAALELGEQCLTFSRDEAKEILDL